MRRVGLAVICCALVASVLAGASIAGAEEAETLPEPAPTESPVPIAPEAEAPAVEAETPAPEAEALAPEGIYEPSSLLVGCGANFICLYSSTTYNNPNVAIACGVGGPVGWGGNSATNRCGNKTNWLRVNGNAIACMNPGGNRPHPGSFNEVFVAHEYGALC